MFLQYFEAPGTSQTQYFGGHEMTLQTTFRYRGGEFRQTLWSTLGQAVRLLFRGGPWLLLGALGCSRGLQAAPGRSCLLLGTLGCPWVLPAPWCSQLLLDELGKRMCNTKEPDLGQNVDLKMASKLIYIICFKLYTANKHYILPIYIIHYKFYNSIDDVHNKSPILPIYIIYSQYIS